MLPAFYFIDRRGVEGAAPYIVDGDCHGAFGTSQ